ncbi:MAG TPA: dTDP-4-dehydrorhamnose 3,5-epimerase family protein, partial [bacterium]|nr:dTDP-4-dehydrorhamnose 3,5-epimerase family protein [bacterium]
MNFIPGKLSGVWLIEFSPATDIRGFFSRIYCQEEFKAHGLDMVVVQTAISFNRKRGTLRGLHFQRPPFWEKKLVCCLQGSIFDVVVDLRETSPTRWQWWAVELSAWNHRMLYIPEGFAHGYQTLSEPTTIL